MNIMHLNNGKILYIYGLQCATTTNNNNNFKNQIPSDNGMGLYYIRDNNINDNDDNFNGALVNIIIMELIVIFNSGNYEERKIDINVTWLDYKKSYIRRKRKKITNITIVIITKGEDKKNYNNNNSGLDGNDKMNYET